MFKSLTVNMTEFNIALCSRKTKTYIDEPAFVFEAFGLHGAFLHFQGCR